MMEKYVTSTWTAVAPGLGNHLWQSTLVALMAGLLTLALRKHHARSRYWLWLAASLKFLVPFSLLVELGQRLTWMRHSAQSVSPGFYFAIDQIGQPFSQSAISCCYWSSGAARGRTAKRSRASRNALMDTRNG